MEKKVVIAFISIVLVVLLISLILIYIPNDDDKLPENIIIEEKDLVIAVSDEPFANNNTYVFVVNNQSVYQIITQRIEVNDTNLSSSDLQLAYNLLSIIDANYSYLTPNELIISNLNDTTYHHLENMTMKVDFSNITHFPTQWGMIPGYFQIDIFLNQYEDSIRYYWQGYPNIETHELADYVLNLI